MTEKDKEFVSLYTKAIDELRTGGHDATQKMLDFWGVKQAIENPEIYKRVQLMIAQEQYYTDHRGQINERDWFSMSYRLGAYKDDFKAYVNQLIQEYDREPIPTEQLQKDMSQYNALRKATGWKTMEMIDPTQNSAIAVHSYGPEIRHGHTDDIESMQWEEEDLAAYSQNTEAFFGRVAINALNSGTPLIHVSPEQITSLIKMENKDKEQNADIRKTDTSDKKVNVKQGSKLAELLSKFAEKSIEAKEAVEKRLAKIKEPEHIGKIQEGMQLIVPANTLNMTNGQLLPEMTVDVLNVWQAGGHVVMSTSAGILTTRDMSQDLHNVIQAKNAEMTYNIEHADEIRAREEAARRAFDYKHNWFANMQHQMPKIPRDDRLDIDDMRYFGYTPESFAASQLERSRDYEAQMANYLPQAYAYAKELVQKCLDNNIQIIYAGDYRSNFRFYGETPELSSRPDFSYGAVPDKWTDTVYMPDTCIDAITGEPILYDDAKMKDIWDTVVVGENPNKSFGIVGETVNGNIVMVTSLDVRDVAREILQERNIEIGDNDTQEIGEDIGPDLS